MKKTYEAHFNCGDEMHHCEQCIYEERRPEDIPCCSCEVGFLTGYPAVCFFEQKPKPVDFIAHFNCKDETHNCGMCFYQKNEIEQEPCGLCKEAKEDEQTVCFWKPKQPSL